MWSTPEAEILLQRELFEDNALPQSISLDLRPFAASRDRPVALHATACGKSQDIIFHSTERTEIEFPLSFHQGAENCVIKLKIDGATSPRALGMSHDPRKLGISLYQIDLE